MTPGQARFAKLLAEGLDPVTAFPKVYSVRGWRPSQVWESAHNLAEDPRIRREIALWRS